MSIDHSGADIAVPEQLLNRAGVVAILQEVCREQVSGRGHRDALDDSGAGFHATTRASVAGTARNWPQGNRASYEATHLGECYTRQDTSPAPTLPARWGSDRGVPLASTVVRP